MLLGNGRWGMHELVALLAEGVRAGGGGARGDRIRSFPLQVGGRRGFWRKGMRCYMGGDGTRGVQGSTRECSCRGSCLVWCENGAIAGRRGCLVWRENWTIAAVLAVCAGLQRCAGNALQFVCQTEAAA
eukprot:1160946-Pelagomonas_calceolata.AAC.3